MSIINYLFPSREDMCMNKPTVLKIVCDILAGMSRLTDDDDDDDDGDSCRLLKSENSRSWLCFSYFALDQQNSVVADLCKQQDWKHLF